MSTIPDSQSRSRLNTPSSQRGDGASNGSQHTGPENRDTATLLGDEETEEVIEAEIALLRANARRTLIAERDRLRAAASRAPGAIIAGPSSVPAGGASAPPAAGLAGAQPASGGADEPPADSGAGDGEVETEIVSPKAKELKPEKMRSYSGKTEGEHTHWFQDATLQIARSPSYFRSDRDKLLYLMPSLEGDPRTQWYHHTKDGAELEGLSYEFFKQFCLNLIADPVNRRLAAYERWEEARQLSNQKVTTFKAYLEELEGHIPDFEETHRAFFFLSKLRSELKTKILGTGQVPQTREGILGVAIMQEKNLERTRGGGGGSNSNPNPNSNRGQPKSKGSKGSKPQHQQQPRQNPDYQGGRGKQQSNRSSNKRSHDVANPSPDLKDVECYHCHEKGHYASNCPHRHTAAAVGDVAEPKKESAPPARRRRSQKDQ